MVLHEGKAITWFSDCDPFTAGPGDKVLHSRSLEKISLFITDSCLLILYVHGFENSFWHLGSLTLRGLVQFSQGSATRASEGFENTNELYFIVSQVVLDMILYVLVYRLGNLSVESNGRQDLLSQRQ